MTAVRVVVTGAGGFIGWHLTEALAERGDNVQAWVRDSRSCHWEVPVEIVPIDITDRTSVQQATERAAPDAIFHLAGQSSPQLSWQDPTLTYRVNVLGTIHLLESVRGLSHAPRVLVTGSSAEYAEPPGDRLISEVDPTVPSSPYGATKVAVDHLVQLYVRRYGLNLVRIRPFYLTGPRKTGDVSSDFARRIVAIEKGEESCMRIGSLDVVRDILDIRDGVEAFLCIGASGKAGEVYNVCSGIPVTVGTILEIYRGLARTPIKVVADASLLRPLDQKFKVGNPNKLQSLGWRRKYDLGQTLGSILAYWRQTETP